MPKVVPRFAPANVPTISKHGTGWRVQIRRLGHKPLSKTFRLKAQAYIWADKTEREILEGRYLEDRHTVKDALDRFIRDVAPKRKGARWELLRIGVFKRSTIISKPISRLTSADLAAWRDDRLKQVSGASVRRDMNLWDSVLETARKEWGWITINPIRDVKKPPSPRSRQRGVRDSEITALRERLTGKLGREVFLGFELGIETAMRAGEMWSLNVQQIDLSTGVVHLSKTKNGDHRDVPLSPRAIEILKEIGRFTVSTASRDALFRKARKAAGIQDLHFHDSRSEGITRLSKKLDILELARVVGHRDIKSLMHYYRADAAAIARRLADPGNTPLPPRQTTSDSSPESE